MVDAVRHAVMGFADPRTASHAPIHEYCSISGVGIWFECLRMQLVLRDIAGDDPALPHVQWALTEIADECRHSIMFARTAETFSAPSYQPPSSIQRLGKAFAAKGDGPAAYAAILVAEEILDIFQRDLMKDERVQPLTRATSQIHVVEEAWQLRARGDRPPDALAVDVAAAQHRTAVAAVAVIVAETSCNRRSMRPSGWTRGRPGPRPARTRTTGPSCGTRRPGWWRSCATSGSSAARPSAWRRSGLV
jgi:hypothetical protein